jgi:hypothetical protein
MLHIINNLITMRPRSSTIEADSMDEYLKKAMESPVGHSSHHKTHPLAFNSKKKFTSAPLNKIAEADISYEVEDEPIEAQRPYKSSMEESLQLVEPRTDSEFSENLLSPSDLV